MASIIIEAIHDMGSLPDNYVELEASLNLHIHSRIEKFKYKRDIPSESVPIAYIGGDKISSKKNLRLVDRSYMLNGNTKSSLNGWLKTTNSSITTGKNKLLITDQVFINSKNRKQPLFWAHKLPTDTVKCSLKIIKNGRIKEETEGYKVDLETGYIYTNYKNTFDEDTGAYKIFFIETVTSDGVGAVSLLDRVPVIREATWEDVDQTTGTLYTDRKVYTLSTDASGTTYYLNVPGTYYYKEMSDTLLNLKPPFGDGPEDFWFTRVSNVDLSVLTGTVKRYWVPEYNFQNFFPYKPYVYSSFMKFESTNDKILKSLRPKLAIKPEEDRHLNLFVYSYENELLKVLTTDTALDGKRYSNTNVFYESNRIQSWDNEGGFISLAIPIHASWWISGETYFEADDFEYQEVNLNPIMNPDVADSMVVIYCIPNVLNTERAIHHLIVDKQGKITYCSQGEGYSYSNLQPIAGGLYNPSTVYGMTYVDESSDECFISLYCCGYENSTQYVILGEYTIDMSAQESTVIDVRQEGGCIRPLNRPDAYRRNHRLLQSKYGYGEDGEEVPQNGVIIIKAPITLLKDYGGSFVQEDAEAYIKRYLHIASTCIIEWEYPKSTISVDLKTDGEVTINYTWEGEYAYFLLRRVVGETDWTELDVQAFPARGDLSYVDTTIVTGTFYEYAIKIIDGFDNEYPLSNLITVLAK